MTHAISPEPAVRDRYAAGAQEVEPALCCPVDYDRSFLKIIPQEVIDKDYGCGDPSKHVREGETVLDLGSGTGKICFIASQVVGASGKVIGVDMTDDMLEVARRNAPLVAEKSGSANVEFRKGRIQDLTLDLEKLDAALAGISLESADGYFQAQNIANELRAKEPMIPDASIDVVVSNCVLNLVDNEEKAGLFRELYRVVKPTGRAVISDIVANKSVPEKMQKDPDLWSGCVSGAYREDLFIKAFEEAGFQSVEVLSREENPWKYVEGIEFRSMTVAAYKGEAGDGQYCSPESGCC
ncbi:MAG: methyltransferase domain-containing protein [Verrucomicrobiota bacterium]